MPAYPMLSTRILKATSRLGRNQFQSSVIRFYSQTTTNPEINSLDDLVKLKSLDDVDPLIVQKLINEKTTELNIQNEIRRLQMLQKENEKKQTFAQPVTLGNFKRAGIMFVLMSSSVYLTLQLLWWSLSYDVKEKQNLARVTQLQDELHACIEHNQKMLPSNSNISDDESSTRKSWFSKWW